MNPRTRQVGPRGAAVLGIAGVTGIVLAIHGWGSHPVTPAGAGLGVRPAASSPAAPTAASAGPSSSAPGPLLTSQAYAQYAFAVWPGTPSATAKTAETGLTIAVSRRAGGVTVTAGVTGQSAGSPHFYPSSAAIILVLAHGWILLVLAVALIAGVAPRLAAAVTAVLMLEIVVSLLVTGGLSDLTMRDLGVLGLALCMAGAADQRLVLTR